MCGAAGGCLPSGSSLGQGWPPACPVQRQPAAPGWGEGRKGRGLGWTAEPHHDAAILPLRTSPATPDPGSGPSSFWPQDPTRGPAGLHCPMHHGNRTPQCPPKHAWKLLVPELLLTASWTSKTVPIRLGTAHMLPSVRELPDHAPDLSKK